MPDDKKPRKPNRREPSRQKKNAASGKIAQGDTAAKGERIAKIIARAGLCSRRDAERWIADGRVQLDGEILETAAVAVRPGQSVLVDGQPLPAPERARLWRFHKPKGVITSRRDPEGRATVFDGLPTDLPRLEPVGRLDFNSEGLLLFTNDGELKRRLELPATGWSRRYRVRVHGKVDPAQIKALEEGITVEGINYGPIQAHLEHQAATNAWLAMTLREGKNREIRRICEHLGLTVNRLIRVSYGPFQLGDLSPGRIEAVPARILRDQLGLKPDASDETPENGDRAKIGRAGPSKTHGSKISVGKTGSKRPRPDRSQPAPSASNGRKSASVRTRPPKGATDLTDVSPAKSRAVRGKSSKPGAKTTTRTTGPKSGGGNAHRRRPS